MFLVYMANTLNGTDRHSVKNELSSWWKLPFSSPEGSSGVSFLCILAKTLKHALPFLFSQGIVLRTLC